MNRITKRMMRVAGRALLCLALAFAVSASSGIADASHFFATAAEDGTETADEMLAITDQNEIAAVQTARQLVSGLGREPRIIATSPATVEICKRLDLDLVGVSKSSITKVPKRYKDATRVGTAMAPDMEIISSLQPDWILSPQSLQPDLQPKYEAINTQWAFLNNRSVPGMYRSVIELGQIFGREKEADRMVKEFKDFYSEYSKMNKGKKHPKVLVLMGLPGSYIIATENSYVGSLVKLAGGENVYDSEGREFLNVNTEDMKTKKPDVILRAAHALPDQVIDMFDKDFKENDIWKHFDAVKAGRVYDLTYENFGMSANFNYPEALEELQPMLYPESGNDIKKAQDSSRKAKDKAKKSDATEKYEKMQKGE